MITLIKVARVLAILMLAVFVIALVMALGTRDTGLLEKAVLVGLVVVSVYVAAKISTLASWAGRQLSRH